MQRPALSASLKLSDFKRWYWLKAELVVLCRGWGLGTTGSKLELESKIVGHLSGVASKPIAVTKRAAGEMPSAFKLETVIGRGWRCNPALGAFFRVVCGKGFRFNAAMRTFIHEGVGRTLGDAAICYHASVQPGRDRRPIARQLEYNQHFRDFFAANPEATREDAIEAWWERRSKRNDARGD